ncbi:hypothetical protein EK21DRAFT_94854 [Setomelanomma holmii]|uniref:Uncharacterized protein n=1 Tax=Setomelanomma holmii TaxID=210430 RepID=A0A9P4LEP9_9PLEO|nr:hypothetical protein EK21DRAFT_94854 [Setomelanomma holmii]
MPCLAHITSVRWLHEYRELVGKGCTASSNTASALIPSHDRAHQRPWNNRANNVAGTRSTSLCSSENILTGPLCVREPPAALKAHDRPLVSGSEISSSLLVAMRELVNAVPETGLEPEPLCALSLAMLQNQRTLSSIKIAACLACLHCREYGKLDQSQANLACRHLQCLTSPVGRNDRGWKDDQETLAAYKHPAGPISRKHSTPLFSAVST